MLDLFRKVLYAGLLFWIVRVFRSGSDVSLLSCDPAYTSTKGLCRKQRH